jgi:two-component system response regulator PilR (NtrC family)
MIRVLIVDDEDAILTMLKLVLESAAFQVETAHSAAQAQSCLQKEAFDVVLTDMRMESATAGYDVVRAARQLRPRPAIAILTAFPIAASEWRKSGADALLIKGSEVLRLPETLQSLRKIQLEKEAIFESSRYASRRTG